MPDDSDRAKNHFHNPAKPVSDAGLKDTWLTGHSAILWAEQIAENEWGYENFKGALRSAFTGSGKTERQLALQRALRTAGHLMHLIQDMGVPAHTRNDLVVGHTLAMRLSWPPFWNPLEFYLKHHPELIESSAALDGIPSFPILQSYFDTGRYRTEGFQPVSGTGVGLAEYSNSTFFSDSTIRAGGDGVIVGDWFPHPSPSQIQTWDESRDAIQDFPHLTAWFNGDLGSAYAIRYEALVSDDPERDVRHLAVDGFWADALRDEVDPSGGILLEVYHIDEACMQDYLVKLVPKSIAYSAGLLAHLFRGDVDFTYDPATAQVRITNRSAETMQGLFRLYYDNYAGGRGPLAGAEWTLTLPPSASATVTAPPMPRDASVENTLALVFEGRQGAEVNYVTGKETRLPAYRFSYSTEFEHFSLAFPSVSDSMTSAGTGQWRRSYGIQMANEHGVGDPLISRSTSFSLRIQANPAICKSLGGDCVPGAWLTLSTSTYNYPWLVEYFKVEVGPGAWIWLYDLYDDRRSEGWPEVATPLYYDEGLWTPSTGYVEEYRGLTGGNNLQDECTLSLWQNGPGINLYLTYEANPATGAIEPRCSNAESLVAEAHGQLADYLDFYYRARERALEWRDVLLNDDWLQYGFEVRVNQLIYAYGEGRRAVILDTPATFTKRYGSNQLEVY